MLAVIDHAAFGGVVAVGIVTGGLIAFDHAVINFKIGKQTADGRAVACAVVAERAVGNDDAVFAAKHADGAAADIRPKWCCLVVDEQRIDDGEVAIAHVDGATVASIEALRARCWRRGYRLRPCDGAAFEGDVLHRDAGFVVLKICAIEA